jgi:hypothetical protein
MGPLQNANNVNFEDALETCFLSGGAQCNVTWENEASCDDHGSWAACKLSADFSVYDATVLNCPLEELLRQSLTQCSVTGRTPDAACGLYSDTGILVGSFSYHAQGTSITEHIDQPCVGECEL